MQRALNFANPMVQACLRLTGAGSFWQQWIEDLSYVHENIPQLQSLVAPTLSSMDVWCTYIVVAGSSWTALLKKWLTTPQKHDYRSHFHLPPHLFTDVYFPAHWTNHININHT
eukprot:5895730-Amphidinium_carterae.1